MRLILSHGDPIRFLIKLWTISHTVLHDTHCTYFSRMQTRPSARVLFTERVDIQHFWHIVKYQSWSFLHTFMASVLQCLILGAPDFLINLPRHTTSQIDNSCVKISNHNIILMPCLALCEFCKPPFQVLFIKHWTISHTLLLYIQIVHDADPFQFRVPEGSPSTQHLWLTIKCHISFIYGSECNVTPCRISIIFAFLQIFIQDTEFTLTIWQQINHFSVI